MTKEYKKSIFIFRRDLRLQDNTALIEACRLSEKVLPVFILDPRQVKKNTYKSYNAIQFMLESLDDLDQSLKAKGGKLFVLEGQAEKVISELMKNRGMDAVFLNKDYTPFALKRDSGIEKLCHSNSIDFKSFDDALLQAPGKVLKKDGKPYSIYTPFYNTASLLSVSKVRKFAFKDCFVKTFSNAIKMNDLQLLPKANKDILLQGGRKEGLKLLQRAIKLSSYDEERNFPAINGTSALSAHHKFGTLSIREVHDKISKSLGKSHTFIKELYWRDFFTHVGFHFPRVFEGSFYKQYDKINWGNDKKKFEAWCEGKTGFPIVDAGMRELNTTGFMHNRVRMIVASFLTKDLHIDWHWGEKYFAQQLIDYDPAVNNGNWQWAASTGCDAQPYFRIFNPWRQQERFDSECLYIKHWIPELSDLSAKEIHNLYKDEDNNKYIKPIVQHKEAAAIAGDLYISARELHEKK